MALLKFIGREARTLAGYKTFQPGDVQEIPAEQAKNLVGFDPGQWAIVPAPGVIEERRKKYADDRKSDTKKEDLKNG